MLFQTQLIIIWNVRIRVLVIAEVVNVSAKKDMMALLANGLLAQDIQLLAQVMALVNQRNNSQMQTISTFINYGTKTSVWVAFVIQVILDRIVQSANASTALTLSIWMTLKHINIPLLILQFLQQPPPPFSTMVRKSLILGIGQFVSWIPSAKII